MRCGDPPLSNRFRRLGEAACEFFQERVGFFRVDDEQSAAIAVESIALELVSEPRFQEIGAWPRIGPIGKKNGVVDFGQAGSIILRHSAQPRPASRAVSSPLGCSTGKA
jgi:hypothetical protein